MIGWPPTLRVKTRLVRSQAVPPPAGRAVAAAAACRVAASWQRRVRQSDRQVERKEKGAMAASDDFTKLKEQVEEADRSIKEAVAKEDAELKAMVDEARKNADDRAAQLRAKTQ